jgi:hypothetical protein
MKRRPVKHDVHVSELPGLVRCATKRKPPEASELLSYSLTPRRTICVAKHYIRRIRDIYIPVEETYQSFVGSRPHHRACVRPALMIT